MSAFRTDVYRTSAVPSPQLIIQRQRHVLNPQRQAPSRCRSAAGAVPPNTKEVAMPLVDKIEKYTVSIFHNDIVDYDRSIRLSLESGGTAQILFPATRPQDWLQFSGPDTTLYLTAADYQDVYHLLQTESPVFFTALNFLGLRVGHVHTELDPAIGEPPGEGDRDANSLEAVIRQARAAGIS